MADKLEGKEEQAFWTTHTSFESEYKERLKDLLTTLN